jgi:preprotein translocase subunit SecF
MGILEKHYKIFMIIPLILLLLSIGQIAYQYSTTGEFITQSLTLKGGAKIQTEEVLNRDDIYNYLKTKFPNNQVEISTDDSGQLRVILADVNAENFPEFEKAIKDKGLTITKTAFEDVAGLGASFYNSMMYTVLISFILMSIVVYIAFRSPAPSFFVILCAFSDIIETVAVFNLLGFKLLKGGLAAFLMLIGYSVDTDILLTNRVLFGKEGTIYDRCVDAFKTGMKMSITTIAAVLVAYIFAIPIELKEIMAILLIGLLLDILNTWITNAGILRWYLEWKEKKKHE